MIGRSESATRSRIIGVSAEVAGLIASKILGSGVNMQSTFFLQRLGFPGELEGVVGGIRGGSAERRDLGSARLGLGIGLRGSLKY